MAALSDGTLVVTGGMDGTGSAMADVYTRAPGVAAWVAQSSPPWSVRVGRALVAMDDDTLLLLGGEGFDDVYRSTDHGATWTQQTAAAGWGAREGAAKAARGDGTALVVGGVTDGSIWHEDVWRTDDYGSTWSPVIAAAPFGPVRDASLVFIAGEMYLLGLRRETSGLGNQTWRSTRGSTWRLLSGERPAWEVRDSVQAVATNVGPTGSLALIGGRGESGVLYSDVWTMHAPRPGLASGCVVEDTVLTSCRDSSGSTLYLQNIGLTSVHADAFEGLDGVSNLLIYENRINWDNMANPPFRDMAMVNYIDFTNSSLREGDFAEDTLDGLVSLQTLRLHGNPLLSFPGRGNRFFRDVGPTLTTLGLADTNLQWVSLSTAAVFNKVTSLVLSAFPNPCTPGSTEGTLANGDRYCYKVSPLPPGCTRSGTTLTGCAGAGGPTLDVSYSDLWGATAGWTDSLPKEFPYVDMSGNNFAEVVRCPDGHVGGVPGPHTTCARVDVWPTTAAAGVPLFVYPVFPVQGLSARLHPEGCTSGFALEGVAPGHFYQVDAAATFESHSVVTLETIGNGPRSVAGWVQFRQSKGEFWVAFGFSDGLGDNHAWVVAIAPDGSALYILGFGKAGTASAPQPFTHVVPLPSSLVESKWYHIAATWWPATQTLTMVLDGAVISGDGFVDITMNTEGGALVVLGWNANSGHRAPAGARVNRVRWWLTAVPSKYLELEAAAGLTAYTVPSGVLIMPTVLHVSGVASITVWAAGATDNEVTLTLPVEPHPKWGTALPSAPWGADSHIELVSRRDGSLVALGGTLGSRSGM